MDEENSVNFDDNDSIPIEVEDIREEPEPVAENRDEEAANAEELGENEMDAENDARRVFAEGEDVVNGSLVNNLNLNIDQLLSAASGNQELEGPILNMIDRAADYIGRTNEERILGGLLWLERLNLRRRMHQRAMNPNSNNSNGDNDVDDDEEENTQNLSSSSSETDVPEDFDTDLPGEHLYLGTMARVSGVDYLEINKLYRIIVVAHYTLVFPGEILPMILPDTMFNCELQPEEGLLFGIIFLNMWEKTKPKLYGVTCQIFEKSEARHGCTCVKTRAHQRFVVTEKYNDNFTHLRTPTFPHISYANIFIQPELSLPDPLTDLDVGSMNRFGGNESMSRKIRHLQASTTPWPPFVYELYNQSKIIEKAKTCLESYKILSMPTDSVNLSFWLARNLLFDSDERINVFTSNYVNVRMRIMSKYLNDERCFLCRRCRQKIANCRALFAMSKHGVQTNYCNPCGFIHETNTVYEVDQNAVYLHGGQSVAFSWFPGYSWQIILCRLCDIHLGWKFEATDPVLTPRSFYGLSGNNIEIQLTPVKTPNLNEQTTPESTND